MFAQWENLNSNRSYPFSSKASLISELGTVVPDNILVDVSIMRGVHNPETDMPVWVSSIHISNTLISICFTDKLGGIASCSILRNEFKPYTVYKCTPMRDNVDAFVTFGDILFEDKYNLNEFQPIHTYRLNEESGRLSDTAIYDIKTAGVIKIIDEVGNSIAVGDVPISFNTDHVRMTVSGNVVKTYLTQAGNDAIAGPCNIEITPDICGAVPIKSLAGVPCNKNGEIVIRFKTDSSEQEEQEG
jgi:hypothetical protein